MNQGPSEIVAALRRLGLLAADEVADLTALPGGVSSDIWRVDLATGPVCVKRALAILKVEVEWRAPVERNAAEVAWFEVAGQAAPGSAPEILAHDPAGGLFVMQYLDPATYPLWKDELHTGRANPAFAARVAECLLGIHEATAGDPEIAEAFANDETFHAIRLEPYLEATARVHPDRRDALTVLAGTTAATKHALVHGDVSPKNILIGPQGPVFLDAECAWYGDPAFDLAFCLNHMLLKCLWTPDATQGFLACYDALAGTYCAGVGWEGARELEARTAHLLPGLFLGRVDGKSPVEYLTLEAEKDRVRRVARALLAAPVDELAAVRDAWARELAS